MNTRCHALLRSERAARRLGGADRAGNRVGEILDLWRSDFRTRATEEKVLEFGGGVELATQRSQALLKSVMPSLAEGEDLVLVNPSSREWRGMPVEVPLHFRAGQFCGLELRSRQGTRITPDDYQIEVIGRHRDGSIREATLVIEPEIEAHGSLTTAFAAVEQPNPEHDAQTDWTRATTNQVQASFLAYRGAALNALCFPELRDQSLLGTIPHGTFDEIAYTPDFYSGHVVAVAENGSKETDLRPVEIEYDAEASGAIRLTVRARFESRYGPWRKSYRLYHRQPRLDVVHDLAFNDARLANLRLGSFTLSPEAWALDGLHYGTINGGGFQEWRSLTTASPVEQSQSVSSSVSAASCLGATEGWVAIEDGRQGLLIQGERADAAVAPMLDFRGVNDQFFCRLSHSAAEDR